mgnify:CR=1 FL=1
MRWIGTVASPSSFGLAVRLIDDDQVKFQVEFENPDKEPISILSHRQSINWSEQRYLMRKFATHSQKIR